MSTISDNNKDFKSILGNYPIQMGVGKSINKEEILNSLWARGSRLIDLGCSYPGKNTKIINNFISDKQDEIVLCQQFPLEDEYLFKKTNIHIYEATDEELKYIVDTIIKEQMTENNVEFYHIYTLHSIFSNRFYSDIRDEMKLYTRVFRVLKEYKDKGIIQHIGFSASIAFNILADFIYYLQEESLITDIDVALVSYNILTYNVTIIRQLYNLDVWDSPDITGLRLLKDNNFTIICINPFERGLVKDYVLANPNSGYDLENLTYSAYNYIFHCKYIDYVLIGTTSIDHLNEIYQTYDSIPADTILIGK